MESEEAEPKSGKFAQPEEAANEAVLKFEIADLRQNLARIFEDCALLWLAGGGFGVSTSTSPTTGGRDCGDLVISLQLSISHQRRLVSNL